MAGAAIACLLISWGIQLDLLVCISKTHWEFYTDVKIDVAIFFFVWITVVLAPLLSCIAS
jgi:hypothetical protein